VRIAWRGPVLDRSPWAAGTRGHLAGLRAIGATVALEPLLWQRGSVLAPADEAVLAEMARRPLDDVDVTVQHVPGRILDPYVRGRLRVALTALPGATPGEDWLMRLDQMDDVWVPTAAQRDALVSAGLPGDRVAVIPEPVEVPAAVPAPLAHPDMHGTVVLAIVDWTSRSGWDLLLDAWCRAFGPGDDVTLVLHAYASDGVEADFGARALEAVTAAGHDPAAMPDVVILDEPVPVARMGALYSAAHVVCAPGAGLGRGRDLLEGMAHGRPVIGRAGACGTRIDAAIGWELPEDAAGRPDRDALVAAFRDAHARRDATAAMGAAARARVVAVHDAPVVARHVRERLATVTPRPRRSGDRSGPRVALYGAVTRAHSLALANRSLAAALVRAGDVDLSLVEVEPADPGREGAMPTGEARRAARRLFADMPEVTIRHGYPPSFARPPAGRLVVALPWEFGPIPRDWRRAIEDGDVDEVWACSRHVRDGYLASGLDPEIVHVVPHGIDPLRYRPGLAPLPLPGAGGGYRFLFVGGLLWRKGADLLLDAYRAAFTRDDDVTLIVKDFGRGGPYQPQEAEERVRAMAADPTGPRVHFMRERLTDDELPRLYASADCLVHPYRGEGYGLTVAEGMACGLPVIVPEGGSTADFCDADTALLVASHPLVLDRDVVGDLTLTGPVSVIEVLVLDLARRMRDAYEQREAARETGRRASAHIRAGHTWDAAAAIAARRLRALAGHRDPRVAVSA
jgi:glycosyltransferase involved in cell wall biosynthesis